MTTTEMRSQSCHGAEPPAANANVSAKQMHRRHFKPSLPSVFSSPAVGVVPIEGEKLLNKQDLEMNAPFTLNEQDRTILRQLFPHTIDTPFLKLVPAEKSPQSQSPMRVGVVLSGGQAAGGHNVICGVFDFIKRVNSSSVLYGFLGGPHGVYSGKYIELTSEIIDRYRNMGGFDMIKSGRHKIETEEQKQNSLKVCQELRLDGLIVIGGDDSNTNAAILAEYFKAHSSATQVVGCPKTIDGDLKNYFVEISFGFDTACRTYSNSIGNMMMMALTQRDVYHFVRLMGRSASLLTLECALRTRPNLALIGEEVLAKKQSLKELVKTIADLVEERHKCGHEFGVILLPEGLIEFIPEMGTLIGELNHIIAHGAFSVDKLSPHSRSVFDILPLATKNQLLLDRDPHGNVQVALIQTEKLLLELTTEELRHRNFKGAFHGRCSYLGYEGRSGFPSDFDATYCYALGNVAGALIQNKGTSCMAVLKGMSCSNDEMTWEPAGVPLCKMMNLETRHGRPNVPVIKKFLVDIEKPLFKAFERVRHGWRLANLYCVPGPMELSAPHPQLPFTLTGPPSDAFLLPSVSQNSSNAFPAQLRSPLQEARAAASIETNALFLRPKQTCIVAENTHRWSGSVSDKLKKCFPFTASPEALQLCGTLQLSTSELPLKRKVGLVVVGEVVPGTVNVALGVIENVSEAGGEVFGTFGVQRAGAGLPENLTALKAECDQQRNLNAFALLGSTVREETELVGPGGAFESRPTNLDVLVFIGGTFLGASLVAETLRRRNDLCHVVSLAASGDFCEQDPLKCIRMATALSNNSLTPIFDAAQKTESLSPAEFAALESGASRALGFDSQTKAEAELVGNLMTDSNSAAKYFYFCRVGGGRGAEAEVSWQTHPNIVLLSDACSSMTPALIAERVADKVVARCMEKKNFGVLLMNEDFFLTNNALRTLAIHILANRGDASALPAESKVVFESLPEHFRRDLVARFAEEGAFSTKAKLFPFHECLAAMVSASIKARKESGFNGSFSPICFDLGSQVRGCLPSVFDCSLGYTLGLAGGMLCCSPSLSKLPASTVFVQDPTLPPEQWQCLVVPTILAASAFGLSASETTEQQKSVPVEALASALRVQIKAPTFRRAEKSIDDSVQSLWLTNDLYLNSGPMQFPQGKWAEAEARCNFLLSSSRA